MKTHLKALVAASVLAAAALGIWFVGQLPPETVGGPPRAAAGSGMQAELPAEDSNALAAVPDEEARTEIVRPEPADEGPRLVIHVTRSDTGGDVADQALALVRNDGQGTKLRQLRTDQFGVVTVENILPGSLVTMPRTGTGVFQVVGSGTTHHEIVLEPRFEVEGVVIDQLGQPVGGASVFAAYDRFPEAQNSLALVTGPDGRFRLTGWSVLMFVYASAPGYATSASHEVFHYRDRPIPFLQIVVRPAAGSLSGTVVDALHRPVPGARVWLRQTAPVLADPEPELEHASQGTGR